jgi:hypothetical protein
MGKNCIDKNEQNKKTGNPPHFPAQYDEKAGRQLEGAKYNRPDGYSHTCEYSGVEASADSPSHPAKLLPLSAC